MGGTEPSTPSNFNCRELQRERIILGKATADG